MRTAIVGLILLLPLSLLADDDGRLAQALKAAKENNSQQAVAILSDLIKEQPDLAEAYYQRGRERFRLGEVEKSVADFDKLVELQPDLASRQWERGIACYYAGKYEAGAKQFELYQTFHDQDVENSVWRYLCVVPIAGVEKARENMLPIKNDRRVPMMDIYEMFRGKKTPDDVFAAAKAGDPLEDDLKQRLFYAHLYVGLYYESLGKPDQAKPHILEAANKYRIGHYMGDVARIHAERLEAEKKK
jgi:lipoprotein NlpI